MHIFLNFMLLYDKSLLNIMSLNTFQLHCKYNVDKARCLLMTEYILGQYNYQPFKQIAHICKFPPNENEYL